MLAYGAEPTGPGRDRLPRPASPTRCTVAGTAAGRRPARGRPRCATRPRTRTFWALVAGFAICGATTNGLIGTHFVPAAHDHGMAADHRRRAARRRRHLRHRRHDRLRLADRPLQPADAAGGVLPRSAASGCWCCRCCSSDAVHPSIVVFVVIYGLDWVATVPPTAALCRRGVRGRRHRRVRLGVRRRTRSARRSPRWPPGLVRDRTGTYTVAWFSAAVLCVVAAVISVRVARSAWAGRARRPPPDRHTCLVPPVGLEPTLKAV